MAGNRCLQGVLPLVLGLALVPAWVGAQPPQRPTAPRPRSAPRSRPERSGTVDRRAELESIFRDSQLAKSAEQLSEILRRLDPILRARLPRGQGLYARQLAAWAHHRRGMRRIDADQADLALADFEAAVRLDPNHWEALHQRAVSYAEAGRTADALADLDRLIELAPDHPDGWFNRAQLRLAEGNVEGAVDDLKHAVSLRPDDSDYWALRGEAWLALGEYASALGDLDEAIRLEPALAEAYAARAEVQIGMEHWRDAARDYRAAIRIDPELGRAYRGAAWLMATCPESGLRQPEMALRAAQKAREIEGDEDPGVIEVWAAALASAGRYHEAVQQQQRVVDLVGSDLEEPRDRLALYAAGRPFLSGPEREPDELSGAGRPGIDFDLVLGGSRSEPEGEDERALDRAPRPELRSSGVELAGAQEPAEGETEQPTQAVWKAASGGPLPRSKPASPGSGWVRPRR